MLRFDLHFLQARQISQPRIEDRIRLDLREPEPLHQLRLGFIFTPDDADHLIDIQVCDQQAVENVQACHDAVIAKLQAPAHSRRPELQPLLEQLAQIINAWPAVEPYHVHVDPVITLEVGGCKQVRHERVHVDTVRSGDDHQARGVLVIGFITQIVDHRELLRLHLACDLLEHPAARNLVRKCDHDDVAVFPLPDRTHADRAVSALVDRADLGQRRDDLGVGGIVRGLDVLTKLLHRGIWLFQQSHAGGGNLARVVRRDIGCHTHRDPRGPVQHDLRYPRRQHLGLLQRGVEVGDPVHRTLIELRQQRLRKAGEPRLRVAHGGERLGIVHGTPVPLAVNQRITKTERLRHQHHGLVTRTVSMGMKLAQYVTHRARRFLELGSGIEPELRHGIHNSPLHRLETVTDMGQRTIQNHVHRVIQVGLLGECGKREALDIHYPRSGAKRQ